MSTPHAGHMTPNAPALHQPGFDHAMSLIAAGKVDESDWKWEPADEDGELGDPNDWAAYAKMHLATDANAAEGTKARHKFPYGKAGKVYRRAVAAIRTHASAQGADAIHEAAGKLMEAMDAQKAPAAPQHASTAKRETFTIRRDAAKFAVEDREGKLPKLSGYCIVWGQLSDDRGGFKVRFSPGSAKPTPTVLALCNHNFDEPMGSTENGTLALVADDYGVKFTLDPADTTWSRDAIAVARHLKDAAHGLGMSFGMCYEGQEWQESQETDATGQTWRIRTFSSFNYDEISTTVIPAFTGTTCESEFHKAPTAPAAPAPTPNRNKLSVELQELELEMAKSK